MPTVAFLSVLSGIVIFFFGNDTLAGTGGGAYDSPGHCDKDRGGDGQHRKRHFFCDCAVLVCFASFCHGWRCVNVVAMFVVDSRNTRA